MYLLPGVEGGLEFGYNLFHNSIVLLRAADNGVSVALDPAMKAFTTLNSSIFTAAKRSLFDV